MKKREMIKPVSFFRHLETQVFCLLITTVLVACRPPTGQLGTSPLSTPEVNVTSSNAASIVTSTSSPITASPTPTATPDSAATNSTPLSLATATFVAATTFTPTPIEPKDIDTPTPILSFSPTPLPTLTPTPTFEPLSDKPIEGYVFGKPEEIQGVDNTANFDITGWVPGSSEDMVIVGGDFVDIVNIRTEEKQRLFEWNPETRFNVGYPVWLPSAKEMALILGNFETKQYELWISDQKRQLIKQPYLINVERSFIPIIDSGLGIQDLNTQTVVSILGRGKTRQTKMLPLMTSSDTAAVLSPYNIAESNDWVAYYNEMDFLITNSKTKEVKRPELIDAQGQPLHVRFWNIQRNIQWSWDGSKLALLLSQGTPPIPFSNLYIYNLKDDKLQKVQTPFTHFIDAVVWAPDNRHVVASAVIGESEYQTLDGDVITGNTNALFLVDTITMENSPLPFLSPDIASNIGEILWSPDKKYLVARYRFYKGESPVYHIEVTSP